MTFNSRVSVFEIQHNIYSSSDNAETDTYLWIQEPISHLILDENAEIGIIGGIYQSRKPGSLGLVEGLAQEFGSWEAASDEALRNFEQELE